MRVPILDEIPVTRRYIDSFKGYNHNRVIGEDEFYDMENMTSDKYPLLAPRKPRRKIKDFAFPRGLHAHEKLCWIERTGFYYDGEYVGEVDPGSHDMVSMGSYVIIWPDKKIYSSADNTIVNLEVPKERVFVLEASEESYKYIETINEKTVECMKISVDSGKLRVGDSIKIYYGVWNENLDDPQYPEESLTSSILKVVSFSESTDHVLIPYSDELAKACGLGKFNQHPTLVYIERNIPSLDYICEYNNRLWGCLSETNELFCSALGNPFSWFIFNSDSQDSWAVNVGTPGPFTGICAYQDSVLFFKEDYIHRVYGTRPQNFQVVTTNCQGVEKGSDRSVCILDEQIFYKSRQGICVYSGSLPTLISNEFGDVRYKNAKAGVYRKKYYVNMACTADEITGEAYDVQFVYDSARGLWHKEDRCYFSEFTAYDGKLLFISDEGGMYAIGDETDGTPEFCIPWMIQTGRLLTMTPDHKHISKVQVRVTLDAGSSISIEARYDGLGPWIKCAQKLSPSRTGYTIPVTPRRCEFFELRLSGTGDMQLLGMAYSMEQGSEV